MQRDPQGIHCLASRQEAHELMAESNTVGVELLAIMFPPLQLCRSSQLQRRHPKIKPLSLLCLTLWCLLTFQCLLLSSSILHVTAKVMMVMVTFTVNMLMPDALLVPSPTTPVITSSLCSPNMNLY